MRAAALAMVLCAGSAAAGPSAVPALAFVPPPPGSYRLERIMKAPDGIVLDSDGRVRRLAEFTTGKVTLFSFIYTYCTDAKGCPLAYATLHSLKGTIARSPSMRGRVRFVSMSFDPEYDTPAAMRSYGGAEARDTGGPAWHFLTTRNGRELAPMLDGFGQDVSVAAPPPGQRVPVLSHMLKVYLIDPAGEVREIYSTSWLHPAVLLNDIKTLLLEPKGTRAGIRARALPHAPARRKKAASCRARSRVCCAASMSIRYRRCGTGARLAYHSGRRHRPAVPGGRSAHLK